MYLVHWIDSGIFVLVRRMEIAFKMVGNKLLIWQVWMWEEFTYYFLAHLCMSGIVFMGLLFNFRADWKHFSSHEHILSWFHDISTSSNRQNRFWTFIFYSNTVWNESVSISPVMNRSLIGFRMWAKGKQCTSANWFLNGNWRIIKR